MHSLRTLERGERDASHSAEKESSSLERHLSRLIRILKPDNCPQ